MSKTIEQQETKLDELLSMPYILWLHNDDKNSFDWVIECMIKICGHESESASQIAHIVHYKGKCDAKRGSKELITEMYNKLKGAGLTVTMEEI